MIASVVISPVSRTETVDVDSSGGCNEYEPPDFLRVPQGDSHRNNAAYRLRDEIAGPVQLSFDKPHEVVEPLNLRVRLLEP